jgi:antibiotic biosynthesis monooxygenase (ABM) superfamily enzyme
MWLAEPREDKQPCVYGLAAGIPENGLPRNTSHQSCWLVLYPVTRIARLLTTPVLNNFYQYTASLIHSASMLPVRRSGVFLRHFVTITPLLSLNGTLGMRLF